MLRCTTALILASLAGFLSPGTSASSHSDAPLIACPNDVVAPPDTFSRVARVDLDTELVPLGRFTPYGSGFGGAVHCATADFDNDGVADIVVGPGAGRVAEVRVFAGDTLKRMPAPLDSFLPFGSAYSGGVYVAAGDVNGDGTPDIVVGRVTGAPQIRVFDGLTGMELDRFAAYPASFTGGVRVAAGDVDGDGNADVITAPGPGTAGLRVRVFDGAGGGQLATFLPYGASFSGGVFVAAGDVDGDGLADIVTGAGPSAATGPRVRIYNESGSPPLRSFFAFSNQFDGGVTVAAGDYNGDGLADILAGPASAMKPTIRLFDGGSGQRIDDVLAFAGTFQGGVQVAMDPTLVPHGVPPGSTGFHDVLPRFGVSDFTVAVTTDGCAMGASLTGAVTPQGIVIDNLPGNGPIGFLPQSPGVFEANGIVMFGQPAHFGRLTVNGCSIAAHFSNTGGGQCDSVLHFSPVGTPAAPVLDAAAFATCP